MALGYRRAQVGSIAAGEVVQLVQLCVSYAGYFAGLGQPKPNVTPVTIAVNYDVPRQESVSSSNLKRHSGFAADIHFQAHSSHFESAALTFQASQENSIQFKRMRVDCTEDNSSQLKSAPVNARKLSSCAF